MKRLLKFVLIPLLVVVSLVSGRGEAKARVPFFIVLFVLAAAASWCGRV